MVASCWVKLESSGREVVSRCSSAERDCACLRVQWRRKPSSSGALTACTNSLRGGFELKVPRLRVSQDPEVTPGGWELCLGLCVKLSPTPWNSDSHFTLPCA